ncbi:hypothetical protein CVT25_009225 [Psilocybe cyanescens]|uniref:pyranose dehydrogenase (acceptor) n=1 Tax=Psilocybe cyanescens TaxID=93625 RepID=A0A409WW47_PSICY|nr:hypothetical protein CVT25_009225 [Psilocybe cyanescens]
MPFITIEAAILRSYDYVVIGGGTSGLAAAARLSENSSASVLVLEAGNANLGDPRIDIPAQFGQTLGNPKYDWSFLTVKQKNVNDREIMWSRGKGLGGSSAMNFYAWTRPPAKDIDAIEQLGNPGWNWEDFEKYSKKSETFHPPRSEVTDRYPHSVNLRHRGSTGPVQVTIAPHFYTLDILFQDTMRNMGLRAVQDAYGGDINGSWMATSNLDPQTWTRCSSVAAYLMPNINRSNLYVLTQALVARVILGPARTGRDRTITGVEFIYGGRAYRIKVSKEVILSAGTVKSPQILELSGIGQPGVLSNLGIDVEVDLPGVGENVQDHLFNTLGPYELEGGSSHETFDLLRDPNYAAKARALHSRGQGICRNSLSSFAYFPLQQIYPSEASALVNKVEQEVDLQEKQGLLAPGQLTQLQLQTEALRDDTIPDCELVLWPGSAPGAPTTPGKAYISLGSYLNHPFSRGSIIPTILKVKPVCIDVHSGEPWSEQWSMIDLEILLQNFNFSRKMLEVEPLKSAIVCEVLPGPECQTDAQIKDAVGSCSMLPRNKQGVVDPRLKVYGTANLRVADLSIIPLHVAAHPQIADFVKDDV